MPDSLTIALDAMGGDHAPDVVIEGAELARIRHADIRFTLYGDEAAIRPHMDKYAELAAVCDIVHTEKFVSPDMKAGQALRQGRDSSMGLAVNAVGAGRAG